MRIAKNKLSPSKEAYITLMLENLMEIFSLPTGEVYTLKKAMGLVRKKFKQVDLSGFSKLDEILKELQTGKEFLKYADEIQTILKEVDRSKIVKYIYDLLVSKNTSRGMILLLMLCASKEFYSALILYKSLIKAD